LTLIDCFSFNFDLFIESILLYFFLLYFSDKLFILNYATMYKLKLTAVFRFAFCVTDVILYNIIYNILIFIILCFFIRIHAITII